MSSATGGEADSPSAEVEPNMLITLRVKDSEGVRITRTMRRTDKLRDLTDFYLAMVPASVAQGHVCRPVGAFMHYGRKVAGDQTPAEYDMGDGDEVSFFPDRAMSLPVTLTVKDSKGRRITRTMRRIEKLNVLFDLYYAMLHSDEPKEDFFVYHAGKVNGELMPTSYDMEDGDEITFVPISKPSNVVSLKMKDRVGRSVTRTLRRTDKLQDLIDFYHAMVPTDKYSNGEWQVVYGGKTVEDEKTPADYEMEDGDQISLSPVTKASFHYETDDDDEYGFYSASKRSMFVTITVR